MRFRLAKKLMDKNLAYLSDSNISSLGKIRKFQIKKYAKMSNKSFEIIKRDCITVFPNKIKSWYV